MSGLLNVHPGLSAPALLAILVPSPAVWLVFGAALVSLNAWIVANWLCLMTSTSTLLIAWRMRRLVRLQQAERWRERRIREELEAYAQLDPSLTQTIAGGVDPVSATKALAQLVCRTVGEKSVFSRVALLLRDAEGRLACVGSVGVDDRTAAALNSWATDVVDEERGLMPRVRGTAAPSLEPDALPNGQPAVQAIDAAQPPRQGRADDRRAASEMRVAREKLRNGAASFAIPLGEWGEFDREVGTWAMNGKRERRRWRRGMVAPLRTSTGRLLGAIVVCADGTAHDRSGSAGAAAWKYGLERAMSSIEALATKLSRTMENEMLAERLLRAEKLAGLGQLAGGVAHALNNPLTAVLGFAELIAESSNEPRVRKDATTIAHEAMKMRDTVGRLIDFWRPGQFEDDGIEVVEVLDELAAACRGKLQERDVQLVITAGPDTPLVRGSRDRLRQVIEHLLNNAAQAIAGARERDPGEEHAIRITVSHDGRTLHIIISDTGPGFREPARVFDPFYTTKQPGEGVGLGLSICYGIVREHGGEISAFNLHPHGAAVVVELPVLKQIAIMEERVVPEPVAKPLMRA